MGSEVPPRRFRRLPPVTLLGYSVPIARSRWARLLGLALLSRERAGPGLLIPRCSSVHTFGMRFPLDLVFLDHEGRPLRNVEGVPPFRLVGCRGAAAVLELPAREQGPRTGARVTTATGSRFAPMRALFAIYLTAIAIGLTYFTIIGLAHH